MEDAALKLLSDSVNPAGLVAVCRFVDRPLSVSMTEARLVAICADVRDPGNAGTVLRTCDAAGADAAIFAGIRSTPTTPRQSAPAPGACSICR